MSETEQMVKFWKTLDKDDLAEQTRYWYREAQQAQAQRTLRDWFAGQALAALAPLPAEDFRPREGETRAGYIARNAYEYADAMLQARGGK